MSAPPENLLSGARPLGRGGTAHLMVMSIRYQDTFVRQGGRWFLAERRLITDWVDCRPSTA
ncbi:hypothetical protein GCM10027452_04980 [Micromonospora halotolerans]